MPSSSNEYFTVLKVHLSCSWYACAFLSTVYNHLIIGLPCSRPDYPRNGVKPPQVLPGSLSLPSSSPPCVPKSERAYGSVPSDSYGSSGVGYSIISSSLCEDFPSSDDSEKILSPKVTSTDQVALSDGSMAAQQTAVPHASSGGSGGTGNILSANTFSEISSPFASHSDPFQFTVRLPRCLSEPWSCVGDNDSTNVPSKPTLWEEIRCSSSSVTPSTDYIYRGLNSAKCGTSLKKAHQARECVSQPPSVSQCTALKGLSSGLVLCDMYTVFCRTINYHLK